MIVLLVGVSWLTVERHPTRGDVIQETQTSTSVTTEAIPDPSVRPAARPVPRRPSIERIPPVNPKEPETTGETSQDLLAELISEAAESEENGESSETLDAELARFDRNAEKFVQLRSTLSAERNDLGGDTEEEAFWLSTVESALKESIPEAHIQTRCGVSVCEIVLESPRPVAELLARSGPWLRKIEGRAIGEASAAEGSESQSDAAPESFAVLVPHRGSTPP